MVVCLARGIQIEPWSRRVRRESGHSGQEVRSRVWGGEGRFVQRRPDEAGSQGASGTDRDGQGRTGGSGGRGGGQGLEGFGRAKDWRRGEGQEWRAAAGEEMQRRGCRGHGMGWDGARTWRGSAEAIVPGRRMRAQQMRLRRAMDRGTARAACAVRGRGVCAGLAGRARRRSADGVRARARARASAVCVCGVRVRAGRRAEVV